MIILLQYTPVRISSGAIGTNVAIYQLLYEFMSADYKNKTYNVS